MASRPAAPPDPPLSDGVVLLRPWTLADVAELAAAADGDDEIARWLDQIPQPYAEADARAYVELALRGWRGDGPETPFAIVGAAGGSVSGSIGVRWADPAEGGARRAGAASPPVRCGSRRAGCSASSASSGSNCAPTR
jgi:RimJ/RimL family protein N-acetyltransferase